MGALREYKPNSQDQKELRDFLEHHHRISKELVEFLSSVAKTEEPLFFFRGANEFSTQEAADILNVLEGPIEISDCITDEEMNCSKANYCATRLLWLKISSSVNDVINSVTLQDMVNDYQEIKNKNKE